MTLGGDKFEPADKQSAEATGVQIVQQELNLIPTLTVAENMMLSRIPSDFGVIRFRKLYQQARAALDRLGLTDIHPRCIAGDLGVGRQQMVEIAAALDRDCRVLILDEPTAALTESETRTLFDHLCTLKENGVAIIYISHRLDEIKQISDRTTILLDGKVVCCAETKDLSIDQMVQQMSGHSGDQIAHAFSSYASDRPILRVTDLCRGDLVRDVSLEVHSGERVGIAGLVGSGRTELLRAVFGADRPESGQVSVGESANPTLFEHPSQAVRAGLAMITEDRKNNGLLLSQSVLENTTLGGLANRFSKLGWLKSRSRRVTTNEMIQALQIRTTGTAQPAEELSGGNQQKVAIAKWLVRTADVFLFDEPTRGIDVAARNRIYQLLETLASEQKGILIASSDTSELMQNCDRILVLSAGRIVASFHRGEWSEQKIMQAAFAGYVKEAVA